jgi:Tfp pilus assembly protein PilF
VLVAVWVGIAAADEPATPSPLASAWQLLQQGKHAEAEEAYQALLADQGADAALGLARTQAARGHRQQAAETLTKAAGQFPKASSLAAELAYLALVRGDLKIANQQAEAAIALDADTALAWWVKARVLTADGELPEANAALRRLVDLYNERPPDDPEPLRWIGLAAGEYARWNRLSEQFGFLVNEFYPDLLELDPTHWQAHYEAGRLFAEKYNQADATREFSAALLLNPNAAEVHAAVGQLSLDAFEIDAARASADRALEINPELLAARHLLADIHLANFDPRAAAIALQDALKLDPHSEETLGRLAAVYASIDGPHDTSPETRLGKLVAEVTARNPHAGVFYESLADALDRLRRWPASAVFYEEAIKCMPQRIRPPGQLGMMLMRLGEEDKARAVLDAAFRADPFNVRVNNTLKVLEVLEGYQTLETEHFRIRYDAEKDPITPRAMADWLEEVYPQLVNQMGFVPEGKSLFEVFSAARNTDGHGWFSARMVGLPRIHPIGACAGKIVAMQSPTEGKQRFNWARVVKHEFVHVINLQQTDFNIPHWFTEALAVLNEGYTRPRSWNELLVESFTKDKLFHLDTINLGFIRPHSSDEWTLAYCQAELYAQYMLERFGDDAISKMLAAYGDNLTTPEALQRAFGVPQADFEQGYRKFVANVVDTVVIARKRPELNLLEVQRALSENPEDPDLLAQLAYVQLGRRNYPQARRLADSAIGHDPRCALAQYVRARLHLLVGENKEALERLTGAIDLENPQENALSLLAGLKLKSEDYAGAARLYELGAKNDPGNLKWVKSLAAVYLRSGDDEKLAAALEQLAEADADELSMRKKLAQLARAKGDAKAVARWTREALHIDVRDVQLHVWRAEALAAEGAPADAAAAYEMAMLADPQRTDLQLPLAQAQIKADRPQQAKETLAALLEREPKNTQAKELLETLP